MIILFGIVGSIAILTFLGVVVYIVYKEYNK